MARRLLLYDLPDGHPLIRDWLDGLSNEDFFARIRGVQELGPAFSGCQLLSDDLWALRVPIGYGKIANLIFFSLKTGDYLAVHGFTLKPDQSDEVDMDIAIRRKRDLM